MVNSVPFGFFMFLTVPCENQFPEGIRSEPHASQSSHHPREGAPRPLTHDEDRVVITIEFERDARLPGRRNSFSVEAILLDRITGIQELPQRMQIRASTRSSAQGEVGLCRFGLHSHAP
jgi:hypothetical protein